MFSTVCTGALKGVSACLVQVEVDISPGLPGFELVGHVGGEVKEARERVRVALKNAGISLPPMRVTVNLSPADMLKEGTGFDLPIAVGILMSMGILPSNAVSGILLSGELSLGGEVKRVKGILPIVREASRQGIKKCIVPEENAPEGAVISDMEVVGIECLNQLIPYLKKKEDKRHEMILPAKMPSELFLEDDVLRREADFNEIYGQEAVKRGAEVAAAGFHHMLIIGPPGTGKTMVGKRIPGILPPMSMEESLEVSDIYSVQGLLDASRVLITKRPFVDPHHTVSPQALVGGGRIPRPGAISMAHRGVLFLDEFSEFPRSVTDVLRQPLEDKRVVLSRAYGSVQYPANFMLVCAMNPCPCGFYPDLNKCTCTDTAVQKYLGRVSGPILDRMDICVEAPRVDIQEISRAQGGESSAKIRERVMKARERQEARFHGSGYRFNSDISSGDVSQYCKLGWKEEKMLRQIFERMELSARAYHKLLKVARTIADLEDSEQIRQQDLAEAVSYRMTDQKYWSKK